MMTAWDGTDWCFAILLGSVAIALGTMCYLTRPGGKFDLGPYRPWL